MHTVSARPHFGPRSTAKDLRALMRHEGVTVTVLAWIIRKSRWRAAALRYGSTSWTVTEVTAVIDVLRPQSATVPTWGVLVEEQAA